jgi:toxin ParE1/3/4
VTRTIRLTPRARLDLADIWADGAARWSPDQADRYIRAIDAILQDLARFPLMAAPADAVRPGYRKHPAGVHIIWLRLPDDETLEVVRVLHGQMDIDRHL